MNRLPDFIVCDYLDRHSRTVDRIFICLDDSEAASQRLRLDIRFRTIEPVLNAMKTEAHASCRITDATDAALALNAYLREMEDKRIRIAEAVRVASISINFCKALSIAEIMPALERNHGGKAVSWARGVFRPLRLGSPTMN